MERWQGEDLDLGAPLTSDLIADAVQVEPRMGVLAAGYFMMTALPPRSPAEPWPARSTSAAGDLLLLEGPSRDELVASSGRQPAAAGR